MPNQVSRITATSRVPTRPLSYANKEMAYRKELLVDYTNGMIYVIDENGNEHNVSQQVYEMLVENGDITGDIEITIPDESGEGETIVTIQEAVTNILTDIESIQSNITQIEELIEKLTNEEGDLSIDASNIVQDATHRFLTDVQISNLQEKVSIIETTITINPEDVSGSVAPYSCVKTLSGADPSYPAPLVDIAYTNDVFEDNEAEEEEWYKLHRCIINQANQVTITFKEKPTRAFQMRFQIKVPGI